MTEKINFKDFVQWGFYGLISLFAATSISVFKDVNKSIEKLNTNVAVIIERTAWHKERIDALKYRVDLLETRKN
jgi:hypothetical protein